MTQEEILAKQLQANIDEAIAKAMLPVSDELAKVKTENEELRKNLTLTEGEIKAMKETKATKTVENSFVKAISTETNVKSFNDKGYTTSNSTFTPIEAWRNKDRNAELVLNKSTVLSPKNSYDDNGTGIGWGTPLFIPGIVDAVRTNTRILDKLTTTTVSNRFVYWMEYVQDSGEFECVDPCGLKPCIDFELKRNSAEAKKLAAHLVVCEEFYEDVEGVASTIPALFRRLHDDKLNEYVTEEIKAVAGAYINPAYSGTVENANCADAIEAAIASAACKGCMPDCIMVSCAKYYKLFSGEKSVDGHYIMHPGMTFTGGVLRINGVEVVINYGLADNEYILGDFKKATLATYKQFSIRRGWINDQFIHNVETFVAESRFLFYIPCNHELCFEFDTFDNVLTDIAK